MPHLLKFLHDNPGYLPLFMVGLLTSFPYTTQQIHGSLEIVGVLMLVALFASLLVPFAAFSYPERKFKWWLQNAPLAAFGAYAMEVIKEPTLVKVVLMVCAMGMHLSYWSSGIHSRQYRLDQYKLGFAADLPITSKLISCLNGLGRSDLADQIISSVLHQTGVPDEPWEALPEVLVEMGYKSRHELYNGKGTADDMVIYRSVVDAPGSSQLSDIWALLKQRSPSQQMAFLLIPNPNLGNQRPIDHIRRSNIRPVVDVLREWRP